MGVKKIHTQTLVVTTVLAFGIKQGSECMFLPLTRGFLKRSGPDGRMVTLTFDLPNAREADSLEDAWKREQEKTCCPSCHLLWEQAWRDEMRHHEDCRWPEIVMERNRKKIQDLQAKNEEILKKYPNPDENPK